MLEMKEWDGFEGRLWKEEINVRQFIQDNHLDAVVCIAAALRRGVLNPAEAERWDRPAANTAEPWELSGLGQWVDALQSADRAVTFGT